MLFTLCISASNQAGQMYNYRSVRFRSGSNPYYFRALIAITYSLAPFATNSNLQEKVAVVECSLIGALHIVPVLALVIALLLRLVENKRGFYST